MNILKSFILALLIAMLSMYAINYTKAAYTYEAISFEESLAKLMNDSKIFTDSQNSQIIEDIDAGTAYPNLSAKISPINLDGTTYQYYGFFDKAINYEVVEYDALGNKLTYKLFDDINSIDPKAIITNTQFDKLALAASKVNPSLIIPYVGNGLSSISVNSTTGNAPFVANFSGDTTLAGGGFVYEWDFGDGGRDYGRNVSYVYVLPGNYQVKLLVVNADGDIGTSAENMVVGGSNDCSEDTDSDTVSDCLDACPLVTGDIKNDGCPIFEITTPKTKNIGNECMFYNKSSVIFGHSICSTCPCNNFADFNANVRKCDFIVPALVSGDGKEIYSKGSYFQIVN